MNAHCLKYCVRSDNKNICRAKYLFVGISGSVWWTFLKFLHSRACAINGVCWGFERSMMKGTSLGKQSTFSSISASIRGILLKLQTSQFPRMRYKLCKFGCDRSIMKSTLLAAKYNYSVSRLPLKEFTWNCVPRSFLACASNGVKFGCEQIRPSFWRC